MTPLFSVSDFLAVVNQSLEVAFGAVEVEGEIASFTVNHQKYVFFDLKDASGSVGCFMTVWQLRTPLEDGMKVVVRAMPKVTPWGKFSLTVTEVRLVGEGSLKKSFELLKTKLDEEGLFDPGRKRALPGMPTRVGVVSSTAAAGYADFMKIASDRFSGVTFLVANVQVQGSVAAEQIIRAIEHFNQLQEPPEVLVMVRGGGSADDLAVFNDEPLVRAIAASRVPVLTGIGHETDESLCDLVADVAAVTPSNAAQMLLPDKHVLIARFHEEARQAALTYGRAVGAARESIETVCRAALHSWSERLEQTVQQLTATRALVREYDPEAVLSRGYAILSGTRRVGEMLGIVTKEATITARIETYEER